jgi:hypothetical protein
MARNSDTVRVLVRAEWVEQLPAEAVPEPGGALRVADREVTVWSVGPSGRNERPVCDVRVRAAEDELLAGWQRAAMESAKRGGGKAAPRYDTEPAEPPASWGVRVRLDAHMSDGRRLNPVTKQERDLTLDQALDVLVKAAEAAVRQWRGGTFGVTGRAVLTADGREQLRAEIVRTKGGPDAVVGVIDAMEAVAIAAERLYSSEDVPTDAGDNEELDDLWESVPDETPKFHYSVEFEGGLDTLDTVEELTPGKEIEFLGLWCAAESIGPPDADGVRTVSLRRMHPDQND